MNRRRFLRFLGIGSAVIAAPAEAATTTAEPTISCCGIDVPMPGFKSRSDVLENLKDFEFEWGGMVWRKFPAAADPHRRAA